MITHLFNKSFDHYKPSRNKDLRGGFTEQLRKKGSFRGRLRPATANERRVYGQEQALVTHVFYCQAGEEIQRGDELEAGGARVKVLAVREPSYAGRHLECDCEQVQQGR